MSNPSTYSELNLDLILQRLQGVKPSNDGWVARCPAHDDRNPSLSIGIGDDGRLLVHCFAGCTTEAVCSALGITTADLFAKASTRNGSSTKGVFASSDEAVSSLARKHGQPAAIWQYTDVDGQPVGLAVRFDDPHEVGSKIVLPVSLHPGGWMVKAMPTPRPLYQLTELTQADRVVVSEGEKAADAAASLGLTATTSSGGCKASAKTDWSPLAGHDVVLIPDNDAAGRSYADRVSAILADLEPKPTIRIVELPDLPESGDMVEFIEARGGCVEQARHDLDELIENTPPIEPVDLSFMDVEPIHPSDDDWPKPVSLPSPLPSVVAFNSALLPEVFKPWVMDIAERMQCPPDFPAVGAMIAAAGVIGRKIGICPKKYDDWLVVPNLWGVLIGRPSMMKSPPLKEVMRPVKMLIKAADHDHDQAMKQHREQDQESSLRKAALESVVKSKLRKLEDASAEMEELRSIASDLQSQAPQRCRYVVNDATVQALSEVMAENPNGVTLVRDELLSSIENDPVSWLK